MTTSVFTEASAAVATPQVRSPSPLRSPLTGLVLAFALLSLMAVAAPTARADYAVEQQQFPGRAHFQGHHLRVQASGDRRWS